MGRDTLDFIKHVDSSGDLVTGEDGFVVFWPDRFTGAFDSWMLRVIADELDKRNKPWEEEIEKYFNGLKKELDNPSET